MRSTYALAAALSVAVAIPALAQVQAGAPFDPGARIALDPAVKTGTLDNGIHYFIRANHFPLKRAELRLAAVPLGPLTRTVLADLEESLRVRQATVRVDDPLPMVLGHPATLSQVLTNLLGNAVKFVPVERAPALRVRAETDNGRVRVWVEDNGIGIAAEHQDRIFRVFERLHGEQEYPGTGIGLAIVRKAVERMGGRVGVESAPGQGSRFWVELQRLEGVDT